MISLIHLLLAALLLTTSCDRIDNDDTLAPQHQGDKFSAHFAEQPTKTYAEQGRYLRWHEGDMLSIFYATTLNRQYRFDGATGSTSGSFTEVDSKFGAGNSLSRNYALYPYNPKTTIDDKSDEEGYSSISTTLPDLQHYASNSFGRDANTMVAVTASAADKSLAFRNICGYLKLQLWGKSIAIQRLILQGNNNEKLSGEATICASYNAAPTTTMSERAYDVVTLDCGEGVTIGSTAEGATSLWLAIPPTTFSRGFRITLFDSEGNKYEKSTSQPLTIERNTIQPMAPLNILDESDAVTPPNPDSLAFVRAKRTPLSLSNGEGYVIKESIFGVPQNISVIKIDHSKFKVKPVMGESVRTVSTYGTEGGADYAVNACYWSVSSGKATSLIKSDGIFLSTTTWSSYYPRVNGLLYMYDNYIDILQSYDYPDYPGLVDECDNIIACGPVLIDEGEPLDYTHITESDDESMQSAASFYTTRHPRTVIGCDAKGYIYMMVVDGRATGNATGMSIEELTDICRWLGMVEAMNLDGGGSSTLWNKELGVINHPCDNKKFDHAGERQVKSAILCKIKN